MAKQKGQNMTKPFCFVWTDRCDVMPVEPFFDAVSVNCPTLVPVLYSPLHGKFKFWYCIQLESKIPFRIAGRPCFVRSVQTMASFGRVSVHDPFICTPIGMKKSSSNTVRKADGIQ